MGLSVQVRAENVGTFRFIHVFLMETLARWVPNTPEMEVKVLFGRHVWDLAQQADLLGKRAYELRAPLQFSLRPIERYAQFLEEFATMAPTPQKIAGFYDVILPGLAARYQRYLAGTDRLLDEPTVRVMERILDELPQLQLNEKQRTARLAALEGADSDIVAHRAAAAVA